MNGRWEMALYLNTNAVYKDFQMLSRDNYFVDIYLGVYDTGHKY